MKKLLRRLFSQPSPRLHSVSSSFRPTLESLEDRMVPATVDLTTAGASGTVSTNITQPDGTPINAIFQQTGTQPTGSGVIHSFVRLNAGGNTPIDQGYNTDARPLQYNENNSPVFTHSLQLGDVPIVTGSDGTPYREFLLDINQDSSPLLSLDELRIYVGNAPNLSSYDPTSHTLNGLTPVFDLGDNTVLLNARLSHGSGSGDMLLDVPDALLTQAASSTGGSYIYLYSKFGVTDPANGGYEEWAVRGANNMSSLSGYVYDMSSGTPVAFPNVTVTLSWTNSSGQTSSISMMTNANGFYLFSGLSAGTYSITETVPGGYQPDGDSVGTLGGDTAYPDTQFTNIVVPPDVMGWNYDFLLLTLPSGGIVG